MYKIQVSCLYALLVLLLLPSSCGRAGGFRAGERALIDTQDSLFRVLNVFCREDSLRLRKVSVDFSEKAVRSPRFRRMAEKMLATVQSPEQDGVGLAAPQVGISRRVVVLQRFDKEGEPFEVYPNLHIEKRYGPVHPGPEGCLSVPGRRGIVPRHDSVTVTYIQPETFRPVRESVGGFTAVIFQHETDHLDGILYLDRADSVFVLDRP